MNNNAAIKSGITIIAIALFVLSGCTDEIIPDSAVMLTGVRVFNNGSLINNGYVFLHLTIPSQAELSAHAKGDDNAVISWSVLWGDDFINLSSAAGSTVTVSAVQEGTAGIRVEASNEYSRASADFNVVVNPHNLEWTFGIFDGETEINDLLAISPGESKSISLRATEENVTYTWENGNPAIIAMFPAAGVQATLIAATDVKQGASDILITAQCPGFPDVIKTFAAAIPVELEEGVLFKWSSADCPISGTLSTSTPINSGYNGIFFRARGNTISTVSGAFDLGTNDRRLIIGGTAGVSSADTGADSYIPGVFDLSRGSFRLTITYDNNTLAGVSGGSPYILRIMLNNNHTGSTNSVLGTQSQMVQYSTETHLRTGRSNQSGNGFNHTGTTAGKLVFNFTPVVFFDGNAGAYSLSASFIQLISQGIAAVTITGIRLEEVK